MVAGDPFLARRVVGVARAGRVEDVGVEGRDPDGCDFAQECGRLAQWATRRNPRNLLSDDTFGVTPDYAAGFRGCGKLLCYECVDEAG